MNAPTVFDPKTFAQVTLTEANSTVFTPVPVGEWPFLIEKADIDQWKSRDGQKAGLKCVLTLATDDPEIVAITGRPKNLVRHEMMLDLTPDGGLDFGKGMNVTLGRAREACNLNVPGNPFAFDMFVGHTVKATIKHELYEEKLQARCPAIAKA